MIYAELNNAVVKLFQSHRRQSRIVQNWRLRPEEIEVQAIVSKMNPSEVVSSVCSILQSADQDLARYTLWLCLPLILDERMPLIAENVTRCSLPDARIVTLFWLIKRLQGVPDWLYSTLKKEQPTLFQEGFSRNLGPVVEFLERACDAPFLMDLDRGLFAGSSLFNQGRYFEAHDRWEDLWRLSQGVDRHLFQGLVNLAVALKKGFEGNSNGMVRLLFRASRLLEPCEPSCRNIDIVVLRKFISRLADFAMEWQEGGSREIPQKDIPILPVH